MITFILKTNIPVKLMALMLLFLSSNFNVRQKHSSRGTNMTIPLFDIFEYLISSVAFCQATR